MCLSEKRLGRRAKQFKGEEWARGREGMNEGEGCFTIFLEKE